MRTHTTREETVKMLKSLLTKYGSSCKIRQTEKGILLVRLYPKEESFPFFPE